MDVVQVRQNSGRSKQAVQPPSPVPSFHRMLGECLENAWRMLGECLENGWRMVGEWLVNGWRMVGDHRLLNLSCVKIALWKIWKFTVHTVHSSTSTVRARYRFHLCQAWATVHAMAEKGEAFWSIFTIVFWLYICDVSWLMTYWRTSRVHSTQQIHCTHLLKNDKQRMFTHTDLLRWIFWAGMIQASHANHARRVEWRLPNCKQDVRTVERGQSMWSAPRRSATVLRWTHTNRLQIPLMALKFSHLCLTKVERTHE